MAISSTVLGNERLSRVSMFANAAASYAFESGFEGQRFELACPVGAVADMKRAVSQNASKNHVAYFCRFAVLLPAAYFLDNSVESNLFEVAAKIKG